MKILFLDLDGTIRQPKSDSKFINDPHDQQLIEGVEDKLNAWIKNGWILIGITNQGGVAAGHKNLRSCITEQLITLSLAPQLTAVYFCPDFQGDLALKVEPNKNPITFHRQKLHVESNPDQLLYPSFRKPGAGMLLLASDQLDMKPTAKVMVGDRDEDLDAALAAESLFYWAKDWDVPCLRCNKDNHYPRVGCFTCDVSF